MLKRILCGLLIAAAMVLVTGCNDDEIETHSQYQSGPVVVDQHEVVE